MRIFLSYASEERPLAESVCRVLESEGHDVFFDRDDLAGGDAYGVRIREAIEGCQVFVFLVSRHSIDRGYALTELDLVEARPPSRRPAIVPVLVSPIDLEKLPPLLRPFTLLEPRGNLPAEVAARVATIAVVPEQDRVRLLGMPGNDGWTIHIDIADRNVREIFYRIGSASDFVSTGFNEARSQLTGLAIPVCQIRARGTLGQEHKVTVKYTDAQDRERGPFELTFDPRTQYVRFTKQVLASTDWVAFREYPPGQLVVYFTHLISYKNAFSEIRYSVDDESLSRRVRFTTDWSRRSLRMDESDETMVELPLSTKLVAVKLTFIDGTESELQRFVVAEMDVDGR